MNLPASRSYPGLIVSAPSSRAGKTTVTLGLLRALCRKGYVAQPYKSGPDYIDTAFHKAASGRAGMNLDTWSMHEETLKHLISNASSDADISVVEGAMGLFDGAASTGQFACGSTADLAALTGWPVILVLDVSSQAATAAAILKGCMTYRSDVTIAGVILNNVASARHERLVKQPIEELGVPILATINRCQDIALPERHLGLVQALENKFLQSTLDTFASLMEAQGGIEKIVKLANAANTEFLSPANDKPLTPLKLKPPGQHIALAQDVAFSFIYSHILESWQAQGAQILPFSPLANEPPPPVSDAVWLPGGYPELHAGKLASAQHFKDGLRALAENNIPVHGECGGYMVLGQGLIDKQGHHHEMLGLLDLETSFAKRKLHLGYRKSQLLTSCSLGTSGDILYGHEFHYATTVQNNDPALAEIYDAEGARIVSGGSRRGNITGTFFHLIDQCGP